MIRTFTSSSSEDESSSDELSCGPWAEERNRQGEEKDKAPLRAAIPSGAVCSPRRISHMGTSGFTQIIARGVSDVTRGVQRRRRRSRLAHAARPAPSCRCPHDHLQAVAASDLATERSESSLRRCEASSCGQGAFLRTSFFCFLDGGSAPFFAIFVI